MKIKIFLLLFLGAIGIGFGVYSKDLVQKNPESLFLSSKGLRSYQDFLAIFPEYKSIVLKLQVDEKTDLKTYQEFEQKISALSELYEEQFDIISPSQLYRSEERIKKVLLSRSFPDGSINLIGDHFYGAIIQEKNEETDFKKIIEKVKEIFEGRDEGHSLKLAGMPYTNYLLDKFSESIQEKVFPLMFGVSFLLIILITRSLVNSLLIFLPCLFGAILSLSAIKYFLDL